MSSDVFVSKAMASDQPALHRLWETVFGDPPELVQAFFNRFPPEMSGWVVRDGDQICSAAYLLYGNWYLNGAEMRPAAYVYAVATEPSMRNKGYAGRLMRAMKTAADQRGLLLYTRPAEPALFPWYASAMNAGNVSRMQTTEYSVHDLHPSLPCRRISPEEYGALRESMLKDSPHLVLSENFLHLQEVYSDGFYALGDGCCAVSLENGTLHVLELLTENTGVEDAISALSTQFDFTNALVRFPSDESGAPAVAYCGDVLPAGMNWGFYLE